MYSQRRVIVAITAIVEILHAGLANAGNVRDGKWNLPEDYDGFFPSDTNEARKNPGNCVPTFLFLVGYTRF